MPRESRSYRHRSRSRSPSRRGGRSPDREKERGRLKRKRSREGRRSKSPKRQDRNRSKDRTHKRRSRSRSRDRNYEKRSRSKSREKKVSKGSPIQEAAIPVKEDPVILNKDDEQKRLEEEMQKRRERIEKWRQERKPKVELLPIQIVPPSKEWTLEDDDDDDEIGANHTKDNDQDPDIDPLDAYMQAVCEEVKQVNDKDQKSSGAISRPAPKNAELLSTTAKNKVTIITAVAKKKKVDSNINKGELMESNMDAMEYSSEEETEDLDDAMTRLAKKKKELVAVDHSKIYYRLFKKSFYIEVPELAKMTQEEVDSYRLELEDIKVRGKGCPKPIKTWAQCGVSKKTLECLKKNGFEKPTPIQAQAIPTIMSGRDLIGIAKTGSGKTLAFVLPMFRHIADQWELEEDDGPIAVILTPTRELAMQIGKECKKFTKALNLNVVCVYGGTGISEQIAELKRGAEIIVCTPGRMIDMLAANNGKVTNLRRCTYIVLDEADRMFDMGFEPQVMRIIDNVRPDRQTVMFSATFPRQMEALARRILTKPVEVTVGGRSVVCMDVEQYIIVLEDNQKFLKLLELLGLYQEKGSILVFVHKQEHADELMKNLMRHSYPCMSLHGGIDQYDRDSTMDDFKAGNIKLLIATSVCARGLDVKDLILVVNYDCPNHYEDYVHRCGRTGRAGNHGFAYTFISPDQGKYAGELIKALELSGASVPNELLVLWEKYKQEAEAEGRKVTSFSGFKGKGFKFDETEAHLADERKKLQKAALGLQDSDDEDAGLDIDQKIEEMFASRKRVSDVAQPAMANVASQPSASNIEKLKLAKQTASMINMSKNLGPEAQDISQIAAAAIMKGGMAAPLVSSKTIAEERAEKINAKLGYRPQQEEEKEPEAPPAETFKRYEEELEINDFPQTARWKVTSKEALAQICEYSEAGITVRGSYIPPNKEPKEGERRLYLGIEATNELSVSKAKVEITRLIKEELVRLQNSYQPINKNRYKVL